MFNLEVKKRGASPVGWSEATCVELLTPNRRDLAMSNPALPSPEEKLLSYLFNPQYRAQEAAYWRNRVSRSLPASIAYPRKSAL